MSNFEDVILRQGSIEAVYSGMWAILLVGLIIAICVVTHRLASETIENYKGEVEMKHSLDTQAFIWLIGLLVLTLPFMGLYHHIHNVITGIFNPGYWLIHK